MRTLRVLLGLCLVALCASVSFGQNQQWVYPPNNINMNGGAPAVTPIPGATVGNHNISNGAYDASGNLLFYVKDLYVYTANSQPMGKLPMPGSGGAGYNWGWICPEIEIVPVPGSELCKKFYVIYTIRDYTQNVGCLCYVTIDCSSGVPVPVGPAFNSTLNAFYYWQNVLEWIYVDAQGLAVSKLTLGNTTRYLFTMGFNGLVTSNNPSDGGLLRWTIDANGVHSKTIIASHIALGYYYTASTYLTVHQMSLSDDQTRLAWGGGTPNFSTTSQSVFEIKLNPATYSYVPGSFHQYYIQLSLGPSYSSGFVSGVEYAAGSNKLYVSLRAGIYCIPSYAASPVLIPGSTSLTQQPLSSMTGSQLQYVKSTGKIVGVKVTNTSANTGTLFSIDPATNSIAPITSPVLESWAVVFNYVGRAFILPDQIDVAASSYPALTPAISTPATVCSGSNITASGSYTGNTTPNQYSWQMYQCDVNGNQIAGYNSGVLAASSAGPFTFPNTSALPCNNYYKIVFSLQNTAQCLTASATQIVYINCAPTPVITGNAPVCQGSPTTLCVNYPNNAQYTVKWTYYVGMVLNNSNAQCITVSPTATTSYNVSVKDNATGCTGNTSLTVAVVKNNPDFTYKINYTSPSNYFTVSATPVNLTGNGVAGFGDLWVIEELDASGNIVPGTATNTGTSQNPTCWWVYPAANTFIGFDGTKSSGINNVTCLAGPSPGKFANGRRYRITRGTWNNLCPWAQISHIITVTGNRNPENMPSKEGDLNVIAPDYSHLKPTKPPR